MYVGGTRPEREKPTGCPIVESLWAVCYVYPSALWASGE